ncbi:MAG: 3-phosphoshikimate 1-carboxyvinyltransferase [Labilithrix sp.]|nr:3-phosphoshikimate 1-carboxyvinyltransferase [Labilithrix sp.]
MTDIVVHPLDKPLVGSVPVPSDKSIGHRALLLSSLCEGKSKITGFSYGEDNVSTANAMRAMGLVIDDVATSAGKAAGEIHVTGGGLFGLRAPNDALDCGNSGTTMRLLTGLLAAQRFASTLVGDASLMKRPMKRVVGPLRSRGAVIDGKPHPTKEGDLLPPLVVGPLPEGKHLEALEYESPVSSAQVKSAVLLSGLYAHGGTWFKEPTLSRDHTERMLHALGVPLRTMGTMIELDPGNWDGKMPAFDVAIPGDASAAAFLLVAAQITPGSRVTVRGVGTNPTRTGLFEIARHMGAGLEIVPQGDQAGEPIGEITAWSQPLRGVLVGGELVPRAIDEIPIACALAARASGTTTIRDAEELRVKESDRIATMAAVLRAFGVTCEELPDGLVIEGREGPLQPAEIASKGDHRIAMTAAVLALLGSGPSRVTDCDCIATSFPRFVGTLRALGARIDAAE